MFEDKWIQKWEATLNRDWTMVRDIWVKKYGEVTRATMMPAKHGGYDSAAELRARRAHPPPHTPPAAPTSEYDALVEYAVALEAKNLELNSVGGGSDVSEVSNLPETTASATATNATATLIEEIKRAQEVHATQIQQLTVLVTTSTTKNIPAPAARGRVERI